MMISKMKYIVVVRECFRGIGDGWECRGCCGWRKENYWNREENRIDSGWECQGCCEEERKIVGTERGIK